MVTLVNRAKMSTSTTGTGTITLGSAEDGYQSFADAGVADGDVVRYVIEDGDDWEIGSGTYTATGTTLTRTVDESSNSDAALNLTGSAVVFITAAAEDVFQGELFAESPNSSAVTPTANAGGSYNSVAIGNGADIGSGRGDSIAIGTDALANQSQALAIGRSATVGSGGTFSTAVGRNSLTNGQSAVALGNSYASGTDSLAAVIDTNSSTYGATGAGAVAIGNLAKATSADSIAIGDTTLSTGTNSLALGADAYALAVNATAIGHSRASGTDSFAAGIATNNALYGSAHAYSVALGYQAVTSADYQIALGSSTAQVKVSGAYTLPTSDGTNGQVLTTNGAGAVTFADAGGGGSLDLFTENYDGTSTAPSATGTNAVAIGVQSTSSATNSVAIGTGAYVTHQGGVGLGYSPTVTANYGAAIGANSAGAGAKVSGAGGVALGGSNTQGSEAFSAVIDNTTTSYGASGANSIAMGQYAKANQTNAFGVGILAQATGQRATAIGYSTTASGTSDVAIGESSTASGAYSVAIGRSSSASAQNAVALGNYNTATSNGSAAIGYSNAASATNSYAIGKEAKASIVGQVAFSNGSLNTKGDTQSSIFILKCDTTDATATTLTTNNSSPLTTNQIVLTNESAISFTGTVVCREDATNGDDYAGWEVKGVIMRQGAAVDTTLGVGIVNKLYSTSGISTADVALSADTTNGGLKVEVTGVAATNLRWVATINTSEVINA